MTSFRNNFGIMQELMEEHRDMHDEMLTLSTYKTEINEDLMEATEYDMREEMDIYTKKLVTIDGRLNYLSRLTDITGNKIAQLHSERKW